MKSIMISCRVFFVFVLSLLLLPLLFVNTQAQVISDTVAFWHYNESSGSTVADVSPNRNNGTAYGTTIVSGVSGNARYFNGSGDYVYVPNPANGSFNMNSEQSFTIDLWFKTGHTNDGWLIRRGLAPVPGFSMGFHSGQVIGEVGNREGGTPPDTVLIVYSNHTYMDNQWHHATFVRDRLLGKLFLYMDGVLDAAPMTDAFPVSLTNDRPLTMGTWETVPGYFTGTLDEVGIFRGARYPVTATSDTVALWHYDEATGSSVIDSSPYHNNGTAYGTTIVPGRFGNARSFDGSEDLVYVPNPINGAFNMSPNQSFTIDLWFKTAHTSDGWLIRRGLAPVPGFSMGFHSGQVIGEVGDREDGTPPDTVLIVFSTHTYMDNQWHHAIFVRDRSLGKLYLYIDGVLDAAPMNDNFPIPLTNDRPLTMGTWESLPEYFTGTLDEVGIFRGAHHPVTVTSDTVAFWHYDEASGSNVVDSSPYGNNGIAIGTTIVPGRFGKARSFNGTGDYVNVPNPVNGAFNMSSIQSFTIDLWFKTAHTNDGWLIRRGLAPVPGFSMGFHSGQVIAEVGNREGGTPPDTVLIVYSTHTYMDNQWHHATFVRDRSLGKLYLYVDGILDATPMTDNFPISLTNDRPLTMGRWETLPEYFTGSLDEVAILKGARHPVSHPGIEVSPNLVNFGNVLLGTVPSRDIFISNIGFGDTLTITSITSNNPVFMPSVSSLSLPPGTSRTIQARYAPTLARTDTGSFSIASNDPNKPLVRVQLSGQGFVASAAPLISSIRDIPEDQGKQVRVVWYRSVHDSTDDSLQISQYSVWRRVGVNNSLWDFIASIPAVRFEQYSFVAPTLFDSTHQAGIRWSVFKVSAQTANGAHVYFSPIDSGYSVDNLAPLPPANLIASVMGGHVSLAWDPPSDPDIEHFAVYRSTIPNFPPIAENLIGTVNTNAFVDQSPGMGQLYYYVTALDTAGNQSGISNQVPVLLTSVGDGEGMPREFQLHQNYPNPFNPVSIIRYDVASLSHVTIKVYDMLGREVVTLVDENMPQGRYQARLNGLNLSSGTYIYRMNAGSFTSIRKMVLMK